LSSVNDSLAPNPRLRGFPQGLGKGHDAAVVSAWLDEELQGILPASVDTWQDMLERPRVENKLARLM